MKHTAKKTLLWSILCITIIPLVLLSLVITLFSTNRLAAAMNNEVKKGLKDLSSTILTLYDNLYEGDYWMTMQEDGLYMMKGDHQLNGNFAMIDRIKENTGADITFFYGDTRVITTITDDSGARVTGTKANAVVIRDVLENGNESFYSRVSIDKKNYFAYYVPLSNSDGECVGMIFVGKPSAEVEHMIQTSIRPILLIALIAMLLTWALTISFSNRLAGTIRKIDVFLEKVAGGNLRAELDTSVLKRNDELGEMGKHAVAMEQSLRELVEQDMLTRMNNRRSGEKLLKKTQNNFIGKGIPYCVAIGDIDHFKQVNDTYGHDCGDLVLVMVASRIREMMRGKGFAARWGGEEFLLVFEGYHLETVVGFLEELRSAVSGTVINYQGEADVCVKMTFGVVEGSDERLNYTIRDADAKLYHGKNNGRNQVVH